MKFKLDENLPQRIAIELKYRTYDVQTVVEEGLMGHEDADEWQAAQR